MGPKYKLIYLNFMGNAEPIRLLFALAGVDFEDFRIPETEWETFKKTMPCKSVPALEEDGKILCESLTILAYLGRKFGRAGSDEFEIAKCEEYVLATKDVVDVVVDSFFEKDEERKAKLEKRLDEELSPRLKDQLTTILKKNGTGVLIGKDLTFADLYVAHMFSRTHEHKDLSKYPEILALQKKVFETPSIKEYIERRPITPM